MDAADSPDCTPDALLRLDGIEKSFGGVHALKAASLDVRGGEIHTILGENGAGKSTLVKVVAGVLRPDAGTILWRGEDVTRLDVRSAARLGIRVIYQRLSTVSHLSVAENLSLGREPNRFGVLRRGQERRGVHAALDRLGVSLDLNHEAGSLPVAERQLIEIARALQGDVKMLVMDEPTASLGEREVERLFTVVRGLRDQGVAVIFISHKLAEVMAISDRITVLRDGAAVATVSARDTTPSQLIEMMVGRRISEGLGVERVAGSAEVLLKAVDLHTERGLNGVSFDLRRGEVLGVYGLMGSGRTELARALFGADRLQRGELWLDDVRITPRSPVEGKLHGMGFVPEERRQGAFEGVSIRENISSASSDLIARHGIIRGATERAFARRIVTSLGVRTPSIETPLRSLSGGNQQKVLLGKWLMRSCRILILDDPTAGIDVGSKAEFYRIIGEQTSAGVSVLMTSSELPELLALASRIMVLHNGRTVGILDGEDLNQSTVLHLALRGTTESGSKTGALTAGGPGAAGPLAR
jgi:ribose transport system ATP-binding protein